SNHDSFSRKILQGISAGYGTTYEAISGDLSKVNFSSGRMGWLESQRQVSIWQYDMVIPMFCDTAWEWFVEGAGIAMLFDGKGVTASWTP
ncbi:phage portal protein, partial [Loigolactobacillus coryniformis]|uniref:phage portal protein n=1 Tax=Loigolactobacillus coryniformis TaxID=1610 RepID=UPI00201AEBD2